MQDVTSRKPRTSRSTLGPVQWILQVSTGIFLIFLVVVHLYLAHINFGHPIVFYNTVLENMHNPWWLLFYIAFVWIVVYHALNGVKGIIYDTGVKGRARAAVSYGLIVVYIATVIYGTALAIAVSRIVIP